MPETSFEIYDLSGKLITKRLFKGSKYKLDLHVKAGLYIIKYIDNTGKPAFLKIVKL